MNEQDWADRFSRDVDGLLNEAGRMDSEPTPTEYHQALDLARILATTDFSTESQVRQVLRRRLLNQIGAREGWQRRKEYVMRTFFRQRRTTVILASAILAGLLVVTLAWPGVMMAAAQDIEDFVQRLVLKRLVLRWHPRATVTVTVFIDPDTYTGRYTGPARVITVQFQQINPTWTIPTKQTPLPVTPVVERRGELWIIQTAIGNFGGNVLPDRDAAVCRFSAFGGIQAAAPFSLRQPGYLPVGYALREAIVTPLDWVFLFYNGPDGDIILAQMPAGEHPSSEAGRFTFTMIDVLTDKSIESVTLEGQPAGWIDGYGLMWEANGVSFILGGVNLNLDEAIRIAESLE